MKKVFLIVLSILARVAIIFSLFILFLVAVEAYQNPVNYIDSVDVIQANTANQKFSEWMTANAADIDTLETLNESVFYACDTTGGQTIAHHDSAFVNLDKEVIEGSIYFHTPDDYAVAVNETGTYEISYQLSASSSGATIVMRTSLRWYSNSWQNIPGASMAISVTNAGGSASAVVIRSLTAGDSLAIYVKGLIGTVDIVVDIDGVGLTIKKLY